MELINLLTREVKWGTEWERREKRGRQEKGKRTRNGKGEEKVKKNPKLKCSSSPPLFDFKKHSTHSYQQNPHQTPPSKKVIQKLVLSWDSCTETVFFGCLNICRHQPTSLLPFREGNHREADTRGPSVHLLGELVPNPSFHAPGRREQRSSSPRPYLRYPCEDD